MTLLRTYFTGMRASVRPIYHLHLGRLWEVDVIRGIAIVMMVIYHLTWDLSNLGGYPITMYPGFWHYFQLATASLFIGLVGVSMSLRYNRMLARGGVSYLPFLRRGIQIFSWGIVLGIITFLFDPAQYIRFGVLHLIGFSIVIAYPFLRWRWFNLLLGLGILLGERWSPWHHTYAWFDWLGLAANPHPALDYFPLIPWFGAVLIGIFLGNTLFPQGKRRFPLVGPGRAFGAWGLQLLGQNSLLLYLIHQPILVTILTLLGIIRL